ncbi:MULTISPECIES: AraC family transcriptional regulator [Trichocoleus]|uniref:AraC family transcriptional regulator n=1 Tax=Trichocoleus desertorum GB2-A4 TaxID=2933944 RepID=A0ABV0J988_9CYAN|nr:AraC family transcriptional regulator [Trichocoleus sp. FACHB-46]MBD1864715.1 helix-turn-helix transcriptional regulator [Trichocoleus sp. FACHB-46]
MSKEQHLSIDHFQKDSTSQVLPSLPLLSSHKSGWNNVCLAQYCEPAWELPEMCSSQHMIIIYAPKKTTNVEFSTEGCLTKLQYHPSDHIKGCVGSVPASLPFKLAWDQEISSTHLYLEPTFVSHVAHETVNPDRVEILFEAKRPDLLIYHIGQALTAALEFDGSRSGFYADSMAIALSAHLLQHYSTRKPKLREYEDGLSTYKLNQAIAYMNDHLSEKVSLAAIAAELNMSQYYFCHLFKQSAGMSPYHYLTQQRIERAKQLLKEPRWTITEVALECGFTTQSQLAKNFRQYTGVSPKQFRKK